jgi:hypothetical protein
MLAVASDQLAEQLDAAHGSEVVDHSIFRAHAAKYEVRQGEGQHGCMHQFRPVHTAAVAAESAHGSEVVDHSIFRAHAAKYEVRQGEGQHECMHLKWPVQAAA